MSFWERYEQLCLFNGYKPGSTEAANALGTSRGTISAWKKSGRPPQMEYLVSIANAYGVSTDYLLCRTDDPTDYTNPDIVAAANIDDEKKAAILEKITATKPKAVATQTGETLFAQLDDNDQGKAEAYMQGLLSQDKYQNRRKKRA